MLEKLFEWALQEVQEVKRAPVGLAAAFLIGAGVGWFTTATWFDERIENLSLQIRGLEREVERLKPPAPPQYDVEINCKQALLPAGVNFEDRITVIQIGRGQITPVGEMWGVKGDAPDDMPWRYRCELLNRGNAPIFDPYLAFNYVLRKIERKANSMGAGDIIESQKRGFFLTGALPANEGKVFWVWTHFDFFVSGEFGERVLATSQDRRSLAIPLRQLAGPLAMFGRP